MIDGEWLASLSALSQGESRVNFGVAPVPPPSAHPERANTTVIQGPVVFIPAGAMDKEAAADLLAWMMSPEIVAEETYTTSSLPTSRQAALDPRFHDIPSFELFLDLLAHPNARPAVTTPINLEINEALGQVEVELLLNGGDTALLLNEVQAKFAPELKER
jgi:ABC-type glycerol-3-phosphate transport system substrate-binding protein